MKFILVIVYLILTTSGLIFMKLGGNSGSFAMVQKDISFTINWISLIGLVCYLMSFLLFTRLVIMFDLSYILPLCTGIVQILSLIAAKVIFKESFTTHGLIGASIIIIGIIIMNLPKTVSS